MGTPHEHRTGGSSALADRYVKATRLERMPSPQNHARRRSPFCMEEGTPRHCVPCSDGQSLKVRPTSSYRRPLSLSRFHVVFCFVTFYSPLCTHFDQCQRFVVNVLIPRVKYLHPIFESEESKKTHVFNAFCDPQLFPPRALVNASKHRLVTGVFGCACLDTCVVSTLFSLLACERARARTCRNLSMRTFVVCMRRFRLFLLQGAALSDAAA